LLDFIHETFNQMTNLVGVPIGISLDQTIFLGPEGTPNNRFCVILGNKLENFIAVIASVSQPRLEIKAFQQGDGLRGIGSLPTGQQQTQWVPQSINSYMDFCAKSTDTLAQSLLFLTSIFFGRTRCTRMGAHDSAVNQQPFHIRIFYEMLMQFVPDPLIRPSAKSFENCIPVTQFARHISPLRSRTHYPMNCINEEPALFFMPRIRPRALL